MATTELGFPHIDLTQLDKMYKIPKIQYFKNEYIQQPDLYVAHQGDREKERRPLTLTCKFIHINS